MPRVPLCYGRPYGRRQTCNEKIVRIRELLAEGATQRAIARELGVSRPVVQRVASGQLVEVSGTNQYLKRRMGVDWAEIGVELPDESAGPGRCPDCGGWVFLPCLACQVRQFRRKSLRNARNGP